MVIMDKIDTRSVNDGFFCPKCNKRTHNEDICEHCHFKIDPYAETFTEGVSHALCDCNPYALAVVGTVVSIALSIIIYASVVDKEIVIEDYIKPYVGAYLPNIDIPNMEK